MKAIRRKTTGTGNDVSTYGAFGFKTNFREVIFGISLFGKNASFPFDTL